MNQLRLDPLSGRWVVISTDRFTHRSFAPRQSRDPQVASADCPFCPGNEDATPPALETYGSEGRWLVRVIPNKFPAFDGNGPFVVENRGPVFTEAPATGIHEVLVFSPDHNLSWALFSDDQCAYVMQAIKDRIDVHQNTPGLRYSQAIVNSGREAGASVEHPHGQLLGIPVIPREMIDEQGRFARFAGGCLLCTAGAAEERAKHRIVSATDDVITFAPYWSGSPYELLVMPRKHETHLERTDTGDLAKIGIAVRDSLSSLGGHLGDFAYNVVFHSAPYRSGGPYHWHAHILPKLMTRAGFELGTGVYINVVAPEEAAENLRAGYPLAKHDQGENDVVAS